MLLQLLMLLFRLTNLCSAIFPPLCTMDKQALQMEEEGQGTVTVQCSNPLWSWGVREVLVFLEASPGLKLCVSSGPVSCHPSFVDLLLLNITQPSMSFTVVLGASELGVRCMAETAVYRREGKLLGPEEEQELPLGKRVLETRDTGVSSKLQLVSLAAVGLEDCCHSGALADSERKEVTVFTRSASNTTETKGSRFSLVLTYLGLAAANFMLGTQIPWSALSSSVSSLRASCRQCSCVRLLCCCSPRHKGSIPAWLVGLLCQTIYLPLIGLALAKLLFLSTTSQCSRVMDLSRMGLFLLATAPGNSSSPYLSTLWGGDLQLSVALVILSTLLNPLTSLFWWNTLGQLLSGDTTDPLTVPIMIIVEFVSVLSLPIVIGMYFGSKFPAIKEFTEKFCKPLVLFGMSVTIVVAYFQYRHFFSLITKLQVATSAVLALGAALAAGLTAYICRLDKEQIISIAIDSCIQNASLTYAVINGVYEEPENLYAQIPGNAQILFTSGPVILSWVLLQGSKKGWQLLKGLKVRCQAEKEGSAETEEQGKSPLQKKLDQPSPVRSRPTLKPFFEETPPAMVRIGDIKGVWGPQHNLSPLWC